MGRKAKDYTGQRFGEWTVLGRDPSADTNHPRLLCRCSCGAEKPVQVHALTSGKSKSCGCRRGQAQSKSRSRHGDSTPGSEFFRLYRIWAGLKRRPRTEHYREIGHFEVCAEWADYGAFKEWALEHGYRPGRRLQRRDGSAGFSPRNCFWGDRMLLPWQR